MDKRPIGVFDSGVGGLTVVKEIIRCMPCEDIIYLGDTARVPYGTKSKQTIIRFSIGNILFLLKHNVKLVIIACNTSSSVALAALKKNFKIPIIGVIEPGSSDAVSATRNKKIGVIGTQATINSSAYKKHILKKDRSIKVFSRSCPLLVPLVEEGWLKNDISYRVLNYYLSPFKSLGIDTLILGCTHYPLLKTGIIKAMGKNIFLVDSAVSTAKAAKDFLSDRGLIRQGHSKPRYRFFVTDEPQRFKRIGEPFLGRDISDVKKVKDEL